LLPQATLVLVFVTLGLVLSFKPQGLMGRPLAALPQEQGVRFQVWPEGTLHFQIACAAVALGSALAWWAGTFWQSLSGDALILVIVGVSLQLMMALGAMVSFGHAAFFGLGAYAAARVHLAWGWGLAPALIAAVVSSAVLAYLVAGVLVRRSGVYLAMLSLSLAQVLWQPQASGLR